MKAHRNYSSSSGGPWLRHRRTPPRGAILIVVALVCFGAFLVVVAWMHRARAGVRDVGAVSVVLHRRADGGVVDHHDDQIDLRAADGDGGGGGAVPSILLPDDGSNASASVLPGGSKAVVQPNEAPVADDLREEAGRLHQMIADVQRDNSMSVADKIQKMRQLIQKSVEAHRLQLLELQKTAAGGGDNANVHEMREAKVVDMIDRLRRHDRGAAGDDGGDDGRNGLRSLNVDEEVARSIAAHRENFERFQAAHHPPKLGGEDHRDGMRGSVAAVPQHSPLVVEALQAHHRSLEELRRTAFGLGGVAGSGEDREQQGGGGTDAGGRGASPSSELRLVIMTTLKSCTNASIRYAQLDAVMSWVALPIYPAPTVVLMVAAGGDAEEDCSAWVADVVNRRHADVLGASHAAAPSVRVVSDVPTGVSGRTILLGAAMTRIAQLVPDAHVYGLVNGDILLDPMASVALHRVAAQYTDYFVVGRRKSVSIPLKRRASAAWVAKMKHQEHAVDNGPGHGGGGGADDNGFDDGTEDAQASRLDFALPGWSSDLLFQHTVSDRQDAEDFFFWSNGFFDGVRGGGGAGRHPYKRQSSEGPIPNFHIGRPAYDNWLVHHAIHTWQPVVDASELLVAYHQAHNYKHLGSSQRQEDRGEEGVGAERGPANAEQQQKQQRAASYWGGVEQQENYNLGLNHGGWQHGMIDYAPLGFEPRGCSDAIRQLAQQQNRHFSRGDGQRSAQQHRDDKGKQLFDWYAYTVAEEFKRGHRHPHRSAGECTLRLRLEAGWKPYADDTPLPQRREAYEAQYRSFETQG